MGWTIAVIVAVLVVAVIVGFAMAQKNNELFESGIAVKNRAYDFYAQEHLFRTVVPDLDTMFTCLDRNVLAQRGIAYAKDTAGRLIFQNSGNSMTAVIAPEAVGIEAGIHQFRFRVTHWKAHNGTIELAARMDANVVLTALEKAFLTLDYNAVVQRTYATDLKTSTSFF